MVKLVWHLKVGRMILPDLGGTLAMSKCCSNGLRLPRAGIWPIKVDSA